MGVPEKVVLHPLVLLSVVDHYNRVARDTKKRVVGVLLGDTYKGQVDVTNSFAVPFEEDDQDPSIWFLDHSYLENMFHMFKKVNGERSTPALRPAPPTRIDVHDAACLLDPGCCCRNQSRRPCFMQRRAAHLACAAVGVMRATPASRADQLTPPAAHPATRCPLQHASAS
jgi:hypothetical protein